jgi:ABC-2 type transport system ATP-binding protein
VIIINKGEIVADDRLSNLKKYNEGSHSVIVQFKEPVDKHLLESISGVVAAEQISPVNFKLTTPNPEAVRKQIFELALQHNLNIVSLQSESQSLEEVFRSLTQKIE